MEPEKRKEFTAVPVTESFFGIQDGVLSRGATELYIPKKYKDLSCRVTKIDHTYLNMVQVSLKIFFTIEGEFDLREIYDEEESWKIRTMMNFFEKIPPFKRSLQNPIPIVGFMLNRYLRVQSVIDLKNNEDVPFDQAINTVFSFDSVKPKPELEQGEEYVYYDKKTTFIYDTFKVGEEYAYEIIFESIAAHFEFGLLFPFGKVAFEEMNGSSDSDIISTTLVCLVAPIKSQNLPELLFEKLKRHLPEHWHDRGYPNHIKPALPYRGEEILFPPNGEYGMPLFKKPEDVPDDFCKEINETEPVELTDFGALRILTSSMIPPHKNSDVIVTVQKKPIPSRIYEQLESIKSYEDVFVNFDIFNLTHERRRIRAEVEIPDYTIPQKKVVSVHGLDSKTGKKARIQFPLCPRMRRGVLDSLVNSENTTLIARVTDEDTKELLFEETFPVTFLPCDQMVWSMNSIRSSRSFNLAKFIAAWVKPKDQDGVMDSIRSGSAKYHPDGNLFFDGSWKSLLEHVKAIYDYLSTDYKMVYVNQPFNGNHTYDSQRVLLPEQTLKNKAGNCIDLTVLFASILEGFGIQSLIFITKDHAFIGWGSPKSIKTMFALETTVVGRKTFEEAMAIGQKNIRDNFMFKMAEDIGPLDLTYYSLGSQIVSLSEARSMGIVCSS